MAVYAEEGKKEHTNNDAEQLHPVAEHRAQQLWMRRWAEHVAVHKFPSRLLCHGRVSALLHEGVAGDVIAEHTHEDDGKETSQQQHGADAIEDGEPADVQVLLVRGGAEHMVVFASSLQPLGGIFEMDVQLLVFVGNIQKIEWVVFPSHTQNFLSVVTNREDIVCEQMIRGNSLAVDYFLFSFPDEAPNRNSVVY